MSAADTLARTSFGGIVFPVTRHVLHGTGRKHVHEYWKSPGGAPEKGGRGLYDLTITVPFHDRFPAYPDLYPNTMNKLRGFYEAQATLDFVHPTLGTFPAFIFDWKQTKEAKVKSGETVDMEILEDQIVLFTSFVAPAQSTVQTKASKVSSTLAAIIDQQRLAMGPGDISLFDALQNGANALLAIRDTANLYGNLVGAKVAQLQNLCAQIDSLGVMQNPIAWPLVDAVKDLWAAAVAIGKDLQEKRAELRTYVVPQTMSLLAIATAIYGDASRQSDLASLNPITVANPLRVPASTQILYYP